MAKKGMLKLKNDDIFKKCVECGSENFKKTSDVRRLVKGIQTHAIVYVCGNCEYMLVTEWKKK